MTDEWSPSGFPDSGGEIDLTADDDSDDNDTWDWGTLVTLDGEVIPPGACEPYRGNKANQREILDSDGDAPHADELTGGGDE